MEENEKSHTQPKSRPSQRSNGLVQSNDTTFTEQVLELKREKAIEDAIEHCRSILELKAYSAETFVNAWDVMSINQWYQEQERILMLTTGACYRLKYDFKHKKIERFHRITLAEITTIQHGYLKVDRFTPLGATQLSIRGNDPLPECYYGLRIFDAQQQINRYNPFKKQQAYRTFRADWKGEAGKEKINDIVANFNKVRKETFSSEDIVSHADIWVPNHVPIVSVPHNKLRLGVWNKDI